MWELVLEYRDDAQRVVSLLLAVAMFRWGGAPERASGATFVILFTVPTAASDWFGVGDGRLPLASEVYVALDLAALLLFVLIALNANRNYPLWLAAFQIVATAAHAVRGVVDTVTPIAHAIMVIGPSYFQLALLAVGLVRHVQRKKRYGKYRDWRVPLPYPLGPKQPPDVLKNQS